MELFIFSFNISYVSDMFGPFVTPCGAQLGSATFFDISSQRLKDRVLIQNAFGATRWGIMNRSLSECLNNKRKGKLTVDLDVM